MHITVDLADTGAVAKAAETRVASLLRERSWSRIGLVNNAAYGGRLGPLELVTPEDLARSHLVNVVAPTWLMGFFIRTSPADVPLRIVNVSSGAAVRPVHGLGAYCSSKAALRMAGMVLGAEIESPLRRTRVPRDTAILSYEPGVVETPMQQAAREAPAEDFPWVGTVPRLQGARYCCRAGPAGGGDRVVSRESARRGLHRTTTGRMIV